jgi:hypothetical protein
MNYASNKNRPFIAWAIIGSLFASTPMFATRDTLDLDVTFIGDREILLQDAHKQLHWPEPAQLATTKPTFSYSMLSKRMNVQPEWSKNGPVRLRVSEPLRRLYKGHIQAGLGNYISPTVNFSYTDLRSREGAWGIRGGHDSSQGGFASVDSIEDVFSVSSMACWGKRFLGSESVEVSSDWSRQRVSFFGGAPDILGIASSTNRIYNVWGIHLDAHNYETKHKRLQHQIKASYQLLNDGGIQEHNVDLQVEVKLNDQTSNTSSSNGLETLPISLLLHSNIDRLTRSVEGYESPTIRQAIFDLHPRVSKTFGDIKMTAGLAFWIDAQGEKPFMFVPEIEASTSLFRDLFMPYLKVDGGVLQNRYQKLLDMNPFLSTNADSLNNTYENIHLQIGMRGSITKAFTFNLSAHHQRFDQFLLWRADAFSLRGETFTPLYARFNQTSLQSDASWRLGSAFTLTGSIKQNSYSFDTENDAINRPWNLPTLQTELGAVYTWEEKVRIGSQIELLTGRKTLQSWSVDESIAFYSEGQLVGFDTPLGASTLWNVQLEYLYNGRLSGWIHLNNILNQANPFLPGYNSQKFRFQMGMNYAF